jgi:ribonuclease HI
MAPGDAVQKLADQIARLRPEDRQRLFEILAARGELPPAQRPPAESPPAAAKEPRPAKLGRSEGPDYLIVFDGGSRGNPGQGYGSYALTRLQDGARRLERLEFGGGYTNNEAEYDTLLAALQDLLQRIEEAGRKPGEFSLEIRGDSALVINQLQGRWQAKEARMAERRDRGLKLLRRFGSVTLKAQPRAESVRVLGH